MKILLVDDSRDIQRLFALYLRNGGFTDVVIADSVAAAYEHLGITPSSRKIENST